MSSKKTVYLAGFISTEHPESLQWRKDVTPELMKYFKVLDPLRAKENLSKQSWDGGVTDPTLTSKDIILRDYNDVKNSDFILMNLENYGSTRPLIGTIVEMGWAWAMQKPIIGVVSEENKLMRTHPFVVEAISHYFPTMSLALLFATHQYREY